MHDDEETDSSLTAHPEVTMRYRLDVVKNGGDEDDGKGGNPPTGDSDDGRQY